MYKNLFLNSYIAASLPADGIKSLYHMSSPGALFFVLFVAVGFFLLLLLLLVLFFPFVSSFF